MSVNFRLNPDNYATGKCPDRNEIRARDYRLFLSIILKNGARYIYIYIISRFRNRPRTIFDISCKISPRVLNHSPSRSRISPFYEK